MKNVKKDVDYSRATGLSNMSTYNFTNPDGGDLVLRNKEWVRPNVPNCA